MTTRAARPFGDTAIDDTRSVPGSLAGFPFGLGYAVCRQAITHRLEQVALLLLETATLPDRTR